MKDGGNEGEEIEEKGIRQQRCGGKVEEGRDKRVERGVAEEIEAQ